MGRNGLHRRLTRLEAAMQEEKPPELNDEQRERIEAILDKAAMRGGGFGMQRERYLLEIADEPDSERGRRIREILRNAQHRQRVIRFLRNYSCSRLFMTSLNAEEQDTFEDLLSREEAMSDTERCQFLRLCDRVEVPSDEGDIP